MLFVDRGRCSLTHFRRSIEMARAAGKPVLIEPNASDCQRYAGTSVITPNRTDLVRVIGAWSS